jgi:hypothetical protein
MDERAKQRPVIERLRKQITGLFRWIKNQWQTNPLPFILVMILLLFLIWITWETCRLDNLGFGEKTYWDWMELLVIPVVLAIGAWWLNKSERENEQAIAKKNREEDRAIADERRHQATLEAYFDRMAELLLKEGLRESREGDEVRSVARTRTLAVLPSLDRRRKGQVLRFLYESDLINRERPIVDLNRADLSEAHLYVTSHFRIMGPDGFGRTGWGLDLSSANLSGVNLDKAELIGTDLDQADLSDAKLRKANLSQTKLTRANLARSAMSGAFLIAADLTGADLTMTQFYRANLTDATVDLEQIGPYQLSDDTIMPDGREHKEWVKDGEHGTSND